MAENANGGAQPRARKDNALGRVLNVAKRSISRRYPGVLEIRLGFGLTLLKLLTYGRLLLGE
jgi:hypothetical protein